jgi:ATP-dependent Clp protease ATP-binding subunit ClpB
MAKNLETNTASDYLIRGRDYLEQSPDFELVGREQEVNKMTAVLMRKKANSILLVGAGGAGASAICMGLQSKKDDPDAPFDLVSKRFFWLDSDGMFSSGDPSTINQNFEKTLRTLERTPDSVLIIDDMRDFLDAARNNASTNLVNALMRAVKKKKFQLIMETRDEDLEAILKCHSDMKESYTMLDIQEPDEEILDNIVKTAAKARLEKHHKVKISEEAIQTALELTNKYRVRDLGLSRAQPERSLTLLDRAMTTYRLKAHANDPRLITLENQLAAIQAQLEPGPDSESADETKKSELEQKQAALLSDIDEVRESWNTRQAKIKSIYNDLRSGEESIRTLEDRLEQQLAEEEQERQKALERAEEQSTEEQRTTSKSISNFLMDSRNMESEAVGSIKEKISRIQNLVEENKEKFEALTEEINAQLLLDKEHVLTEFSNISGVPVSKLTENERAKLMHLDQNLENRVFGQQTAVSKLANQVRVARAGLQSPNKPQASFLFLGPSGVGKTELAKALTESLLDDERALLRFDMSEYMEKHAVAKLIGAPPGYEGYEAGGILTNEMRRNPRRIILFDEIEKAHPDVFNVFLQILDDARLTDNRGLTVSFRDAIILMTTNIGTEHFLNAENHKAAEELALEDLDKNYRPEFLNRFNGRQNIVCFNTLALPIIEKIARREINKLNKMVKASAPEISIDISDDALSAMCKDHYKPVNGARGITGYIEGVIKPEIANTVLFHPEAKGKFMIEYDHEQKKARLVPPANDNTPDEKMTPSAKNDFRIA